MIFWMMTIHSKLNVGNVARALSAAALVVVLCAPGDGFAQTSATGVPNAMQGFSQNRDKPMQIDAASLEMRDKDKAATFSGNVKVVQGDTTMLCKTLIVFYDNDQSGGSKKPAMKASTPGPTGSSAIKRLEAQGGVIVTQKDSTVTGDRGVFDMRANTVTMHGNVLLTKDKNVLRGDRLVVDLTTGVSRVESNSGRVQGVFQAAPNAAQPGGNPSGAQPSPPIGGAGKPLKLNDLSNSRKRNG
jgi:lipopolysaccharide export system protein LptA